MNFELTLRCQQLPIGGVIENQVLSLCSLLQHRDELHFRELVDVDRRLLAVLSNRQMIVQTIRILRDTSNATTSSRTPRSNAQSWNIEKVDQITRREDQRVVVHHHQVVHLLAVIAE